MHWLHQCLEHPTCHRKEHTVLPTRMIDVGSQSTSQHPKLLTTRGSFAGSRGGISFRQAKALACRFFTPVVFLRRALGFEQHLKMSSPVGFEVADSVMDFLRGG